VTPALLFAMAPTPGSGSGGFSILILQVVAIGLVFAMNFLIHLFLALGEGDRVSPIVAAWTPNIFFFLIGLYLLHLRATNRETPSFNPVALWRNLRTT
jgi:lipopolysaccharide export LptBFGC system permease protein LptF